MELVLVGAFSLALGIMLGAGLMAWRAFRIELRRRSSAGTASALARIWPTDLPERSAADIIAGRVRVVLGDQVYELPVLPQNAGARWVASLDESFAATLQGVSDSTTTADAINLLMGYSRSLYEALLAYDVGHVLPPADEVGEIATSAQIFRAVIEVWRAENPLAATLAGLASSTTATPTAATSELSSSSPASTAGPPRSSGASSPPSSSSPTSTPRKTGSKPTTRRGSTAGSRP